MKMVEGCSWVVHLTALGLLCAVAVGGIVSFLDSGFNIATAQSTGKPPALLWKFLSFRLCACMDSFFPSLLGDYKKGRALMGPIIPFTDGLVQNYSCLRMLTTGPLFRPTTFEDDYAVGNGFLSAALPWQMVFGLPGFQAFLADGFWSSCVPGIFEFCQI